MHWIGKAAFGLTIALLAQSVAAQDLVYTPINPSFGGNPMNSSHLQGVAAAQRTATAQDYVDPASSSSSASIPQRSQTDLFVNQLQNRLMSSLSSQVVEAIFGEDPQESGSVVFGNTTIDFARDTSAINLTIVDTLDGSVTEISVPQLLAN